MWEKKERPEISELYLEQNLDELVTLPQSRKVDYVSQMPEGLLEQLRLNDYEQVLLTNVPTGGYDNASPGQCTCESMTRV